MLVHPTLTKVDFLSTKMWTTPPWWTQRSSTEFSISRACSSSMCLWGQTGISRQIQLDLLPVSPCPTTTTFPSTHPHTHQPYYRTTCPQALLTALPQITLHPAWKIFLTQLFSFVVVVVPPPLVCHLCLFLVWLILAFLATLSSPGCIQLVCIKIS